MKNTNEFIQVPIKDWELIKENNKKIINSANKAIKLLKEQVNEKKNLKQKEVFRDVELCGLMLPQKEVDSIHLDFITTGATCFGGDQDEELYRFSVKPTDFLEWFDNDSIKEIKDYINKKYCT